MEDRTGYDILIGLHVAAAIVGFGAVALSGVYGSSASRPARPGAVEEAARYFRSPGRAELLLLVVPFLGLAALSMRPGGADYGAAWVIGGGLVWFAASTLLLGVVRPAEREIRAGLGAPEASAALEGVARAGRRLKWAAAASDLLFVVALALMVSQPG